VLLPTKFSDRVRLDRYAIKDSTVPLNPGDLVVVSLQRRGRDGTPKEFREVGQVMGKDHDAHAIRIAPSPHELLTPDLTEVPDGDYSLLNNVPRTSMEYIVEQTWETICQRVSGGLTEVDQDQAFIARINDATAAGKAIPAGRILTGMGRPDMRDLTLYNCFIYNIDQDSRGGIMRHALRIFDTFARGGGAGWAMSIFRPKGAVVKKSNGRSSGTVTWAELYSFVTNLVEQGGSRRGSSMIALHDWHPDIFDFIEAKSQRETITDPDGKTFTRSKKLIYFANVSVLISNAFMEAVKQDTDWDLVFPDLNDPDYDTMWKGDLRAWKALGKNIVVYRTIRARTLWNKIIEKAWGAGEPGLLFIDRANELSNSWYFNELICSNPCGEVFGPANSVCNLTHVNLTKFVVAKTLADSSNDAETALTQVDWTGLCQVVRDGVRFLDDVASINRDHDEAIAAQQHGERRIGLGILGYGEMLMRLGLAYGSDAAVKFTDKLFERIWAVAYDESANLARDRGAFPKFVADKFLTSGFIQQSHVQASDYWPAIKAKIQQHGIRNVTCLTVAPTGSVSALLGTTGGIEPYFDLEYTSTTRIGTTEEQAGIVWELTQKFGPDRSKWPAYVVTAQQGITPEQHVVMQATAQRWVDQSISKSINMPETATIDDVARAYMAMWDAGCKGGTVYRDKSRDEQVLYTKDTVVQTPTPEGPTSSLERCNGRIEMVDHDAVAPRLDFGLAALFSIESPVGTLHIGIRHDSVTGDPADMFILNGYGDVGADAQAIGRLCSLILRLKGVKVSQTGKLALIQEQLQGIPGRTQSGFAHDLRLSMPDTIAHVLGLYLEGKFPLANLPLGSEHIDSIFGDFVKISPEARRDMIAYLKNQHGAYTEDPSVHDVPAITAQKPHDPVVASKTKNKWDFCPECGGATLLIVPGKCSACRACGYSRC